MGSDSHLYPVIHLSSVLTQRLTVCSKWPVVKATALATGLFIVFAGVEVLLVLTLKV